MAWKVFNWEGGSALENKTTGSNLRSIYLATEKDFKRYDEAKKIAKKMGLSVSKYILALLEEDSLKREGLDDSQLNDDSIYQKYRELLSDFKSRSMLSEEECFITSKKYVLEIGDTNSKMLKKSFHGLLIGCEKVQDKTVQTKTLAFQSSTNKIVLYKSTVNTKNNFKKNELKVFSHMDEVENISEYLYQQIINSIGDTVIEHLDI